MNNDLQQVWRYLDRSKGKWKRIAAASGVDYSTICRIGRRTNLNPRHETLQAILRCRKTIRPSRHGSA